MGTTPEGKVKQNVKNLLAEYEHYGLYQYWPVPAGYGASSLDCIVCFLGRFIAIETKAPGKKPNPRQYLCIDEINNAKGATFVIDGDPVGFERLREYLECIANTCKPKA